jgi:endo-alpha-1,4-polygalactosaminidase (GH114 family)
MTTSNNVKPPKCFYGSEEQYILNALVCYAETRIEEIKQIEANGKRPFFTVDYINQMTEQLAEKINDLTHKPKKWEGEKHE